MLFSLSLSSTWEASQPSMSISLPGTFRRRRSSAAILRSAALKVRAGIMPPESGSFVFRALAFLVFLSACVFFWFVLYRSANYSLYLPLPVPLAAPSSFNSNRRQATFGLILPSYPSENANSSPVSSVYILSVGFLILFPGCLCIEGSEGFVICGRYSTFRF